MASEGESALSIREYNNDRYTIPKLGDVMTEDDAAAATLRGLASLYAYSDHQVDPNNHPFSIPEHAGRRRKDFLDPPAHEWQRLGTGSVTHNGGRYTVTGLVVDISSQGQQCDNSMNGQEGDSSGSDHSAQTVRVLITRRAPDDPQDQTPTDCVISFDNEHELLSQQPRTGLQSAPPPKGSAVVVRVPESIVSGLEDKLHFGQVEVSDVGSRKIVDIATMLSHHFEEPGSIKHVPRWPKPPCKEEDDEIEDPPPDVGYIFKEIPGGRVYRKIRGRGTEQESWGGIRVNTRTDRHGASVRDWRGRWERARRKRLTSRQLVVQGSSPPSIVSPSE